MLIKVTPSPYALAEFDQKIAENPLKLMDDMRDLGRVVVFAADDGQNLFVSNDPDVSMAALAHGERTHRELLRDLVGPGLFVAASGEHWQARRALVRPLFSTHVQTNHHEAILEAVDDFVSRVLLPMSGVEFELVPVMQRLSVEIIVRLTFPRMRGQELNEVVRALVDVVAFLDRRLFDADSVTDHEMKQFVLAKETLVTAIDRRADGGDGGDGESGLAATLMERIDGLDHLSCEQRSDVLRDEVLSVFVAGVETMGALFTSVLWNLAANPDQEDLCFEEASSVAFADLPSQRTFPREGFKWLEANVRETLRLAPPAWALFRRIPRDMEINGVHIRSGDEVLAATWSTHRSPELWREPELYRPERFTRTSPHPGRYFPFGAGPHQCVGKDLSMMEAQLTIGTLLRAGKVVFTGDLLRHHLKPGIALQLAPSPTARFLARDPAVRLEYMEEPSW